MTPLFPPPRRRRRRRRRGRAILTGSTTLLLLPSLLVLLSRADGQSTSNLEPIELSTMPEPVVTRQNVLPPDDPADAVELATMPEPAVLPPDDPPVVGGFDIVDAPDVAVQMPEPALSDVPAPADLPELDPTAPSLGAPQGGPQGTLGVGLPPGDLDDIIVPVILTRPKCRTDIMRCPDGITEIGRDLDDSCKFPECPPVTVDGGGGPQMSTEQRDDHLDDSGLPQLSPGGPALSGGPQLSPANHAVSDDPPTHAFVTASPPEPLRIMECYGTCPRLNCPLHHKPIHTDDSCCPHCELDCTNAICPDLGSACGANEDLVFSEGKCCPSCVRRNTCTDIEGVVQPSVTCLFDPCHEEDGTTPKTCDGHPEAVCRKDQCNGCRAVWTVTTSSDDSSLEEIVECSKCKSDAKDCGNGVYVKRDSDANCEFPLCPKDRLPTLIASGPLMGPMGGGPMGSLGQGGNLAPGPGGGPDLSPAVLEPVMLDCSLVLCKREVCVTGGTPYVPPGECCPVCPPPAIFCSLEAKMCSDGSSVSRDPMNMCKFPSCPEEEDATNSGGATTPRIDSDEVLPVVMIDPGSIPPVLLSPTLDCKMIPCEEPVCAPNVKPHYPDGQCCPICDNSLVNDPLVEDCRHVECLSPLCVEGETPLVPEGECCPVCGVTDCREVPCPEPVCESGETPVVPFGKCCPHCPPAHNQCRNPFTEEKDVMVRCIVDPCEYAKCPLRPEATCRANYCGGCHAIFEVNDEVVECRERTFCTKDARICGDGVTTLVRDHNNNCEFPDCPLDECDERREDCPEVPKECEDGFRPAVPEGECCPSCERKEPVEKCEGVSCPVVPSYCWDNTKPVAPERECCPVCPPEPTKDLPSTTTGEPKDCENKIECSECVNSGCAWDGGLCFDSCSDVVDPTDFCYVAGYLNLETAQEVCEAAEREREDEEICFRHEDCSSCVAEVKGDGETCVWIDWGGNGDDKDGECAAKPLMGRGSTVCLRSEMSGPLPPLPPDLVAPEPLEITFDKEVACWSTSLSCTECLSLGCGGWYGSCLPDCSRIADTKCWSLGMSERFGDSFVTYGTVEAVCDLFEIDRRDGSLCDSVTTCDDCVTTTRADGVRKCKWIEPAWGGDGFCALEGGMMGPASDKCPTEPEVRAPEVHVTAGPNLGPPEKEDVLVCTADVATCSDGRVVGRDPTQGCRFPCDVVVPEVPITAGPDLGPDLGPCAMVRCQDVVCSDGSRGYVPTGECCPTCLPQKTDGDGLGGGDGPCDGVLCPQIRCSEGLTPFVPEGECCERCPPPSPDTPVVGCQEDARVCPDGTVIVRDVDLGCVFPDCPPAQTEKPDEKCKDVVCPQVRCSDGTPFVPQGECCERCPPPDTLVGCPEDARVCPDGTVVVRDVNLKCEFPDCPPAKTEKPPEDEKCEDVVCPYVEPVCKHGKHYVPEGECCRRCPPVKHDGDGDGNEKKCDPSLCTKLKCPPKHEPVVPEGECCPVCVPEEEEPPAEPPTKCSEVACPAIALRCDHDQKPVIPEGSCCPACPPVACEEDYRTCEDGTVLKRDPTNRCVMPECPKPNRPKPVIPDDDDKDGDGDGSSFKEKCPEPVACKGNPCRRAYCAAYSSDEVECVPSYCGVCGAIFVDKNNNEVDCSPKKFDDDEDEPDNLRDKVKKYAKAAGFKKAAGRGKKAVTKKANIRGGGGGGGGGFAKKGGRRKFNGD